MVGGQCPDINIMFQQVEKTYINKRRYYDNTGVNVVIEEDKLW